MSRILMSPALRKWVIRAAGSVVILGILFWFLPLDAIIAGFSAVPLPLFIGVFLIFLLGHVLAGMKWWLLMDRALPFGLALRAHFAGLAANLCLPGAAGGDAVRAAMAQVSVRDGPRVAAAAVADRLIDMLALALLALLGVVMLHGDGGGADGRAGMVMRAAGIVLALLIVIVFALPTGITWLWRRRPSLPGRDFALKMAGGFTALARRPRLLAGTLALSMGIQATFILLTMQFGKAIGVEVALGAWFIAWPMAKISAVLPISLGGLGVREATMAALMVPFGAAASKVVATGLVWQGVLWLTGGLGALVLALSGLKFRAGKAPAADIVD